MKNLKKMIKNMPAKLAVVSTLVAASFGAQATTTLDLSSGGQGTIGGATFISMTQQPTGTGVIDPFVQLDGNPDVKQAYNTTVNNIYNNGSPDNWNHAVRVGNIGFITVNGVQVMRFMLDINQSNVQRVNGNLLTLDEVQIYLSLTPDQSIHPVLNNFDLVGLGSLVYQMDNKPTDNNVLMNYSLNSGSGTGDIYMDIPLSAFTQAFADIGATTAALKNSAYLYLFSRVGGDDVDTANGPVKYPNTDGFEEWAAIRGEGLTDETCPKGSTDPNCVTPPNETPEPATLAILGLGLLGMSVIRRRRT